MWRKSANSSSEKPLEIETFSNGTVTLRRNFSFVEAVGEEGSDDYISGYWEYEEWQMTAAQYAVYQTMAAEVDYLTMENEFLEEENQQQQEELDRLAVENDYLVYESARHDADIDFCLMMLEE